MTSARRARRGRRGPRRAAAVLVTVLCVAASACGVGAGGRGTTSGESTTTDRATSGRATGAKAAPGAVDALSLRGPVDVADAPEVQPPDVEPTPKLPAEVTDATGAHIEITKADRVIALDLYATLTDTIIGLGLQGHLVGRAASDTQPLLRHLPVVSRDGLDLNIEAVLALKPDLVLTNDTIGNKTTYRQLASAGVTVVHFDQVPSIDGITRSIRSVGAVFGLTDQAAQLARQTSERLSRARSEIAALRAATPRKPRAIVLYVRGHSGVFFVLGPGYGAADVIRELGLEDVAQEHGVEDLSPASAESLVGLDPEIILTMTDGVASAGGVDGLLARPGVSQTTAGAHKRIVMAADNQLLSYGPRTPANLVALARAIYTDADHR